MSTPTCATCKYYRPFGARDGDCTLLITLGYYSHMYATDTACRDYKPQDPTQKDTPKQP